MFTLTTNLKQVLPPAYAVMLSDLVAEFARASVAESWKGGGDPFDVPVIETELALAATKLDLFIARITLTEASDV